MSSLNLRNRLLIYLISTLLCLTILFVLFGLYFNQYRSFKDIELAATNLTSSWNYLNDQTKALLLSDEHLIDLEKQWRAGWSEVESNQQKLIEISSHLQTAPEKLHNTTDKIVRSWAITTKYLIEIEQNISRVKDTAIGQRIIKSGGISLMTIDNFYISGQFTDAEYFYVSMLKKSINILDTSGSIYNTMLMELRSNIDEYITSTNRVYLTSTLVIFSIILTLIAIFVVNIIKLNVLMGNIISEQTRELQLNLKELKLTQNQLLESQKQAAIVQLISGIAHEINTPLGISITALSLLEESLPPSLKHSETEPITLLHNNLTKINKLTATLKAFILSTTQNSTVRLNLPKLISDAVYEFQFKGLKNLQVNITPDTQVESIPEYLTQAITPIIQNWLDHSDIETNHYSITYREAQKMWFLIFDDDGNEEPPNETPLNPFVTTKRFHGHLGLGLSLTDNIIRQQLGGLTHCLRNPRGGFRIILQFIK